MQRKIFNTLFAAILAAFITGCNLQAIRPVSGPDAAAAFGHISLPPGKITDVMLYKVGVVYTTPFNTPPQSIVYPNGDFFFENLEPGQYVLLGFMSRMESFYFNQQGNTDPNFLKDFNIDIKPGSVNYLGSFEVTGIDQNFLRSESFDIKRSKTPTKAAILKHLIEETRGTGWDKSFEKALK